MICPILNEHNRTPAPAKVEGVPRVDDRRVLNGIFWVQRSGAPWSDLPERYGSRTTCCNRFVRWQRAGIWSGLLDAMPARRLRRHSRLHEMLAARADPTHPEYAEINEWLEEYDLDALGVIPIEVALGRIAARRKAAAKRIKKPPTTDAHGCGFRRIHTSESPAIMASVR